jgi:hypothetical protein
MAELLKRGLRDRTVAELRSLMEQLQAMPVDQGCADCAMYGGDGFCQRWNVFVPEKNVPEGCPAWVDKEIPY